MKKLLHSYEIWNLEKLRFSQLKHSLFTHVFCTVTVWDLYVSLLIYYPTTHTHTHTHTHTLTPLPKSVQNRKNAHRLFRFDKCLSKFI